MQPFSGKFVGRTILAFSRLAKSAEFPTRERGMDSGAKLTFGHICLYITSRKEFGDEWFRQLLELDGGVMDTPAVVRDLHQCFDLGILLKAGYAPAKPRT